MIKGYLMKTHLWIYLKYMLSNVLYCGNNDQFYTYLYLTKPIKSCNLLFHLVTVVMRTLNTAKIELLK